MGTPTPAPTPAPPAPKAQTSGTKLIGAACCRPYEGKILMSWHNMTKAQCMQECADHQGCNAFAPSGCSSESDENCGTGCHIYKLSSMEEAYTDKCMDGNGFEGISRNTFCFAFP